MRILIVGEDYNLHECQDKFGLRHEYSCVKDEQKAKGFVGDIDIVLDFIARGSSVGAYDQFTIPIFLNAAKRSLSSLVGANVVFPRYGFAGLRTFLNREILEVSSLRNGADGVLQSICKELGTEFQIVKDRVGLVTPRVICMIINEAYFTYEEGTATREDIDLAMKLGTNYPYGPFEWCKKIGVRDVYELLLAVGRSSGNERYAICPLLEKEYLANNR